MIVKHLTQPPIFGGSKAQMFDNHCAKEAMATVVSDQTHNRRISGQTLNH